MFSILTKIRLELNGLWIEAMAWKGSYSLGHSMPVNAGSARARYRQSHQDIGSLPRLSEPETAILRWLYSSWPENQVLPKDPSLHWLLGIKIRRLPCPGKNPRHEETRVLRGMRGTNRSYCQIRTNWFCDCWKPFIGALASLAKAFHVSTKDLEQKARQFIPFVASTSDAFVCCYPK